MSHASVDVVIVGAGAAGLGAARTARELCLSFIVFEAMDRIGGRALTSLEPFGEPWDLGCHWLHSADVNPFRLLADEYGFRYNRDHGGWRLLRPGGWVTGDELAAIDENTMAALHRAEMEGVAGRDVSVWDAASPPTEGADVFRQMINAEWSVEPERLSTIDVARYRDSDEDWPVADGYGRLVARHARGLPVELSTPVRTIGWGGPRLSVESSAGVVEAAAVVVTASTTALARGVVTFDPPLPAWKQEAFNAVPLGLANKVGIAVPSDRLGDEDFAGVTVALASGRPFGYELRPFGRNFASAYLAGPICDELRADGPRAMEAAAIDGLAAVLGNDVRKHVGATAATCWEAEPTILGAYAAALPGSGHRRADLLAPIADRIFFAGEAVHPQYFSTCHGADMSGVAAVRALADRLRLGHEADAPSVT